MIHVEPQPEPPSFQNDVRSKGNRAILEVLGCACLPPRPGPRRSVISEPTNQKLRKYIESNATFWRACLDDLYNAYDGICAYVAVKIPPVVGSRTVDHYVAQSNDIGLAYEWTNFRLACGTMNTAKNKYEDVLDPFEVEDGWFIIDDFVNLTVGPELGLCSNRKQEILNTISRLDLNSEECCKLRRHYYDAYINGASIEFLRNNAPFLASEIERQELQRENGDWGAGVDLVDLLLSGHRL